MGQIVTLEEVKAFMQITNTASDALLDVYIGFIESELEAVVDMPLGQNTYTEVLTYEQSTFDRTNQTYLDAQLDSPQLFIKNVPIANLTLVHGDVTVSAASYVLDTDSGVMELTTQLSRPTATYVAGYTTSSAPANLKGVVELGVTSLFSNNTAAVQNGGNVKSKSIKHFSVTYGNEQTGYVTQQNGELVKNYIASNMHILKRYQRVWV